MASDLTSLRDVRGYTPPDLCARLADFAAKVPADQVIVELGVFRGRTACYLGHGAKHGLGAHVTAIDPWDLPGDRRPLNGRRSFHDPRNRRDAEQAVSRHGLDGHVRLVRGFSVEVAAGWPGPPVGLLFIDGDHTRTGVTGDLTAWRPHLAADAPVIIDDYHRRFPEVQAVVDELAAAGQLAQPEVLRTAVEGRTSAFAVTRWMAAGAIR